MGLLTPSDGPSPVSFGSPEDPTLQSFGLFRADGFATIPNDTLDPCRLKRPHYKSRSGCLNCRKRPFLQCDEKAPRCSHCQRRNEPCQVRRCSKAPQPEPPRREVAIVSRPSSGSCQVPRSPSAAAAGPTPNATVNLRHMKLYHHFTTHTVHTLHFGLSVWETAIKVSVECPSVMHALLCVSSRHLAYLHTDDTSYEMAAATHLSESLRHFHEDFPQGLEVSNLDAFASTAILVAYELWASTEFALLDAGGGAAAYDPSQDRLFRLGDSMVVAIMKSLPWIFETPSMLTEMVAHSPRQSLRRRARLKRGTVEFFQIFYSHARPVSVEQLSVPPMFMRSEPGEDTDAPLDDCLGNEDLAGPVFPRSDRYSQVITRLCLLLSFLPEAGWVGTDEELEEVMWDLNRYIFTFPVIAFGAFIDGEGAVSNDPKPMLLLYHFYRATRILLKGNKHWWAHRRSRLLESTLKRSLLSECIINCGEEA
ncbi:hypothetical protein B0T26DRAFT_641148 [Lasiosphaeria miniovina]|uniref:Zn(2)-C6 fungal-type domain-containing protein n=1 Tax=Lasiosphaeria miniovina TaxID=1954250 RepID=A0AA40AWR3_9PEZI|nr:uncharacterized protein B0T26DRAFT_641148 [Lasiosphaeria miniovina]KAK0723445.1 hypothetical protein B0T26DRAFT_641148 [Lasiosphaeria miniovina]